MGTRVESVGLVLFSQARAERTRVGNGDLCGVGRCAVAVASPRRDFVVIVTAAEAAVSIE